MRTYNKEYWKPIEHFPGYMVSNQGNVKGIDRMVTDKNGFLRTVHGQLIKKRVRFPLKLWSEVTLRRWGGNWVLDVYELVGRAFLPKPDDYEIHPYVVKKIGYSTYNDSVSNLRFERFYLRDQNGNPINTNWEYPEGRKKWVNDKIRKQYAEWFSIRGDSDSYPLEDYLI